MRQIMADSSALSEKQRRVAEFLAAGYTRQEAAKQAGVGERSVYRWLNSKAFQDYVRAEQNRLRGELTSALRRSVMRAVQALEQALDAGDQSQRLFAAKALLSAGVRLLSLLEMAELHERVEQLECVVFERGTNGLKEAHYKA